MKPIRPMLRRARKSKVRRRTPSIEAAWHNPDLECAALLAPEVLAACASRDRSGWVDGPTFFRQLREERANADLVQLPDGPPSPRLLVALEAGRPRP